MKKSVFIGLLFLLIAMFAALIFILHLAGFFSAITGNFINTEDCVWSSYTCGNWSSCINSQQIRECESTSLCGVRYENQTKNCTRCRDNDGLNYYTAGYVFKDEVLYNDHCTAIAPVPPKNFNTLVEYTCSEQGIPAQIIYNCPNGCKNGACVR